MEFEGLIHKNTQIGPQLRVRIFFLEDETNFLISNRFKYKNSRFQIKRPNLDENFDTV